MKRKRVYKKWTAALLAAACMAGNMPNAQINVYAGETIPSEEAGTETSGQGDEITDSAESGDAFGEGGTGAAQESAHADENGGEDAGSIADSGTYTDESGVSYYYNICEDGTADIYDIKDYSGKDIDIPAEVDGCTVTRLTCRVQRGKIDGLTIPETVTYVGGMAFAWMEIGTLRYNALSASTAENTQPSPFSSSKIGSLLVGGDVGSLPQRMFSNAIFQQDELVIHTQTICEDAFWSAEFQKLTIGEEVRDIGIHAFSFSDVGELCWNAADIKTYGEAGVGRNAPFAYASVHGVSFGDAAASIPASFINGVTEFSVSSLEIPSTITSIGSRAFYNPYEGSYTIGELYIGENVSYLGDSAFDGCDIGVLEYSAADAATDGPDGNGPFNGSHAGELRIGKDVTVLPAKIFCGMALEQEELEISGSIVSVEDKALCSGSGNEIRIGTLTVGEHVAHMGMYGLAVTSIDTLKYNAEDAGTNGSQGTPDSPFYNTTVGELQIGAGVRKIPASVFAGIGLEQDALEFPEGVASIGARAFQQSSWRDISIGNVVIGENISFIGRGAFASCDIGKAHICTLESDWASRDMEFYGYETPACAAVEIHGGSDYYSYFTSKSDPENITLLCSDFESSRGEEYFDAEKGCFVTPVTETCTVCGYQKLGGEYADAHTVIFADHDGTEISRQAVHDGGNAVPPEDPERTGWRFTGWDKEYTGVTADLTVTAQYEICRFTVIFMDGDTVLSSQEVEYGSDAETPENPARSDEAWGKWKFKEWDGNYTGVSKDETVRAVFEKFLNEYEVSFYDADGNVFHTQTVKHGGKAEAPQAPEKAADAQHRYIFTGWDGDMENITSDTSFHPVYEAKNNTYTVTFMDGETVLSSQEVEYGSSAEAPENPARPDEAWGKWKFTGWDGNYTDITKDESVYALFEKILNEYEVVFYDADGNVLSRQTVKHGGKAETPQAPQKAADGKYTYVFKGWDADTENITSDSSFRPVYETKDYVSTTSPGAFTVTFMDGEKVLSVQKVESGKDASAPADPARPDEAWGKWKFKGWDGNYTGVAKDETVYALFEKILNEYRVIFYDADGNVLSEQTVRHGEKAKAPQAPQKAADGKYTYVFKGWDADTENITSDTSFRPVYEAKAGSSTGDNTSTYTVTFMDGDTVLDVQKVESGKDASVPADPARSDEAWGKWRFTGWEGSYKNITKDETVYACFEKVWNEYKVIFYDADDNIISTQTVKHGGKAKVPQAPQKAADSRYTYVFKGWDADTENITSDTSFRPVYETKDNSSTGDNTSTYTVTFMDGDRVLDVQKVEAGKDASVPADPTRPDKAWGKWQFIGWKGSYKNITKDQTVYATFEKVLNEYKVIFYDADGNILSTQTVKHGGKAKAPQAPQKAANGKYTYVFKGWDADTENITSDNSFHPVYETRSQGGSSTSESADTYTVTFIDGDKILDVQKVEAGKNASVPADPTRPDEAWGKWRFTGWKGNYKNITKDETVCAVFEKVLNKYKVIFYDADGSILSTQTVKHGGKAEIPQAPQKAQDAQHKYIFTGWDGNTENITSNTRLYPVYDIRTRTYKVTFMSGKRVLGIQEVEYGASASAPSDPEKKADGKHIYKFAGWDADFSFITKDITVHALFDVEENGGAGSQGTNGDKNTDKDKDGNKDKDANKDKNKNKGKDADKDKNKGNGGTGSGQNKTENGDTGEKGTGENGSGPDGKDKKPESGSSKGSGSGTGAGQPETGGKRLSAGNTSSVQKPDGKADAGQESASEDGENTAQQNGKEIDENRKHEMTDDEKEPEKEEDSGITDESDGTSPETADDEDSRADDDRKEWKHPGGFMPLCFIISGIASVAALCAWLYLRVFRKRRIRGTVLDTDGNPVCGILVSLAGEDEFETCTDGQGSFCFDGLEKGAWKLEISRGGKTCLSMDISVGSRDKEESFRICSLHCLRVDHMQEKNAYVVDVTL